MSPVPQSSPSLWDPMDCSPPGSSVHGILQARILEWVAIPFSISQKHSLWQKETFRLDFRSQEKRGLIILNSDLQANKSTELSKVFSLTVIKVSIPLLFAVAENIQQCPPTGTQQHTLFTLQVPVSVLGTWSQDEL